MITGWRLIATFVAVIMIYMAVSSEFKKQSDQIVTEKLEFPIKEIITEANPKAYSQLQLSFVPHIQTRQIICRYMFGRKIILDFVGSRDKLERVTYDNLSSSIGRYQEIQFYYPNYSFMDRRVGRVRSSDTVNINANIYILLHMGEDVDTYDRTITLISKRYGEASILVSYQSNKVNTYFDAGSVFVQSLQDQYYHSSFGRLVATEMMYSNSFDVDRAIRSAGSKLSRLSNYQVNMEPLRTPLASTLDKLTGRSGTAKLLRDLPDIVSIDLMSANKSAITYIEDYWTEIGAKYDKTNESPNKVIYTRRVNRQ